MNNNKTESSCSSCIGVSPSIKTKKDGALESIIKSVVREELARFGLIFYKDVATIQNNQKQTELPVELNKRAELEKAIFRYLTTPPPKLNEMPPEVVYRNSTKTATGLAKAILGSDGKKEVSYITALLHIFTEQRKLVRFKVECRYPPALGYHKKSGRVFVYYLNPDPAGSIFCQNCKIGKPKTEAAPNKKDLCMNCFNEIKELRQQEKAAWISFQQARQGLKKYSGGVS